MKAIPDSRKSMLHQVNLWW